jgi:hypothetical protein
VSSRCPPQIGGALARAWRTNEKARRSGPCGAVQVKLGADAACGAPCGSSGSAIESISARPGCPPVPKDGNANRCDQRDQCKNHHVRHSLHLVPTDWVAAVSFSFPAVATPHSGGARGNIPQPWGAQGLRTCRAGHKRARRSEARSRRRSCDVDSRPAVIPSWSTTGDRLGTAAAVRSLNDWITAAVPGIAEVSQQEFLVYRRQVKPTARLLDDLRVPGPLRGQPPDRTTQPLVLRQ